MSRRLDPALLDDIAAKLDLQDLQTLDRLKLALRLILEKFESWLRQAAADENSWLHRLADLIGQTRDFEANWNILDFLFFSLPIVAFVVVLGTGGYYLWRSRQPIQATAIRPTYIDISTAPVALEEIASLSANEQPPAIFQRVCQLLAQDGILGVAPDQTNSVLARSAKIPERGRDRLIDLARAADHAMFGAWQPSSSDLAHLKSVSQEIVESTGLR